MGIADRPPLHLTHDQMLDAPLSIPDLVEIVRETLDAFLDGHLDLAARPVRVHRAELPFAGMMVIAIDGQTFHLTVTEAL